jgi:hypothetical protein
MIGQHEQLGDGLVKLNEILTEFAPPMSNILAVLGENVGTSISSVKSMMTKV